MKSYWDLTPRERLSLTQDQLNEVWIPREAAMKGILRPAKPVLAPLPDKPEIEEPTQMPFFQVKGKSDSKGDYDFTCLFSTIEDAKAFIAMKPKGYERKYRGSSYSTYYIERTFKHYDVEIINIVDAEEQEAYNEAMKEFAEAKKNNEELQEKYNRALRAVETSAEKLRNNLQALHTRRAELENVVENLKDFIRVAEGDFKMACKFMLKKVNRQLLYDALNEFNEAEGWVWETVEIFGGECLVEDLNPYRDIDPEGRATL